jgi:hypothetical protein
MDWSALGGCPHSSTDARALYRRLGVCCLRDAVSKVLGDPVDPKLARRGDVVMVDGALGICRGEWVECLDRMQPLSRAECAWLNTSLDRWKRQVPASRSVDSMDTNSPLGT